MFSLTKTLTFIFILIFICPLSMGDLLGSIKAQNCGCIPLLYEGFDYPEGDNMHQKVGGTGWGGAWESQIGDQRLGFRVGANTLAYSDLRSNYKSFIGGHYWHLIGRPLDVSTTGALAAYRKDNGMIGRAGTTLWTSFVFQKTQNNSEQVWAGVHNSNVTWYHGNDGSGVQKVLFGYFGSANSDNNGVRYWTVRVNDSYYRTNVPIQLATPIFPVLKFEFGTNSTTLSLFINPANLGSGSTPSVPTWTLTTTSSIEFRHFVVYGDNNIDNFKLDEIRFASNFLCVAPDAATAENLLPVARMSVSAISGVAPLTVQLNGTTSSDPDGTLANYEWTFGDGGTRTGATASYTFNNTGIMYARLKVTDDCGSTNSVSQNILVTDANGQISCLSAPVPEAFPNCAGTGGGVIRMDGGLGTSFNLTHENGTTYPFANSRFSNLPIGNYTLTVTGQSGCSETFNLKMPADSMNCPNVAANGNFQIGMGLEGLSYWDKARAFKDFMKTSDSQLLTFNASGSGPWNTNVASEIPMDTEGYPTVIPANTSIGLQKVRLVLSAGGHLPLGEYVFLYDGVGQISFQGAITTLTSTQGRMTIRVNGTDNLWLHIDASTQGNHLRNFRLLRPEHESNYAAQPFYPPFLDYLCQFNPIRFMDWQVTNASTLTNWSERGKPNDRSQTMRNGISYEYIIQLANTLNRDIWICVPHAASDDYIRNMAVLFRNGLKTNINVFLEYSNEVWNWQFEQAHWVSNNGNQNISYPRRYVERALNAFRIWHSEWSGQTQRVKRVLGTQTGYPYISEQILAQAKGEFDYFSPTFYFGYGGTCLDNLRTSGASATLTDVINCTRESMRSFFPNIRQTYRLAQIYGKPIAHYEGGQHMTSNPTIEPFQTALYASQIDPQIRTLYQEMIDSLRRYGGTTHATAFVLTGVRESRYGSWGHIEDIDQNLSVQPAPKYQVLVDNFRNQGSCNLTVVPLELLNFSGYTEGGKNSLKWQTANELNSSHFDIERSTDGQFFEKIGEVKTKGKNAYYEFIDDQLPANILFYRLKINDLDGSFDYSKIISLQSKTKNTVKIYPSVTSGFLTIENAKSVVIVNSIGQVVSEQSLGNFQSFLNLSTLPNGFYFIKGIDTEGGGFVEKIVKQ